MEILIGIISDNEQERQALNKMVSILDYEDCTFKSTNLSVLETPEKTVNQIWANSENKKIDVLIVSDSLNNQLGYNPILDNLKERIKHFPFLLYSNEILSLEYHLLKKDIEDLSEKYYSRYTIAKRMFWLVTKYKKYIEQSKNDNQRCRKIYF